MNDAGALAAAVRAALDAPLDGSLAATLHAPTVTGIVVDPHDEAALAEVLPVLLDAFARRGVPRGRAFVLVACAAGSPPARGLARALRAALGVPVIAHDPEHSAICGFGPGVDGEPVELNDELREAEAVVVAASARPGDPGRAAALLLPGLAPAAARRALEGLAAPARDVRARAASSRVGLDASVAWTPGEPPRAWVGAGAAAFAGAVAVLDPPRGRT